MTTHWFKTTLPIAALYAFRMLGLFMLIPVFTLYAPSLKGATPALVGLALGAYGLTQGLLQMPFGLLSDKWGRKPLLILGLMLFALGSLIGAYSHSIYGVIIARIFQGGGAIGSVLMATLADLTTPGERTKAMAIIGMTIGLSFSVAMVLSAPITASFGLSGLFMTSVILAFFGLLLVYFVLPILPAHSPNTKTPLLLKEAWKDPRLQALNIGIFCQHFILTATFYIVPLLLKDHILAHHLDKPWHFYLPLMVISFILMIPLIILAERRKKTRLIFLIAILLTLLSQLSLIGLKLNWFGFCGILFVYFVFFNFLEANLPSLISKLVTPEAKGTAMGIYSSFQFLGIFFGGICAGFSYQYLGTNGILFLNSIIALIWLLIAYSHLSLPKNERLIKGN